MNTATRKAVQATVFFSVVGMIGWYFTGESDTYSFLLLFYYVTLVVNTFFSIRAFTLITPKNYAQIVVDSMLALLYVALVFSFSSVVQFAAISAALFLASIGKYAHLAKLVQSRSLLSRKIRLNSFGALFSLVILCIAVIVSPESAAWLLFLGFLFANVYLLYLRPMYRDD